MDVIVNINYFFRFIFGVKFEIFYMINHCITDTFDGPCSEVKNLYSSIYNRFNRVILYCIINVYVISKDEMKKVRDE